MTITSARTIDSPVGVLTLAGTDEGLTHLFMADQAHAPADQHRWARTTAQFADVVEQLDEYFAGQRETFDVRLRLVGTDFQQRVWAALQDIPYGQTRSYGELAAVIGQPGASRAVGLANGRNPVAIIVPCHRVIAAGGGLGGYGGGLDRKRFLLDLEHHPVAAPRQRTGPHNGVVSAPQ
jgi:methylated-DNA-[protein]-cysteine S-methyltransferase